MNRFINYCIHLTLILNGSMVFSQINFVEKGQALGINHSYIFGQSAGGISFIDFNGDGLDDLTLATAKGELIHFYRNTGTGFVRNPPLNGNNAEHKQIFWVDFDNDGDKDLFVCAKGDVNRLYQNDGNMNFTDITASSGLPLDAFDTFNACWADFNRDGWLDLYICERKGIGLQQENKNALFFNNADGTFTDFSEYSNTESMARLPFSSSAFDYDKDGWPDLYVANDRNWGNVMFRNNGDSTFTDVSDYTGTGFIMDGMSIALGDYNNDSWLDFYVTNTPAGNVLFTNQGSLNNGVTFTDKAEESGVHFNGTAWGANFIDADNDGYIDLYVSGSDQGSNANSSAFYHNTGNGNFTVIKEGFEKDTVISYANAIGDYNNDGFPEIVTMNFGAVKSFFYENQTANDHHYLKIKLQGVLSNRDGIGAQIEIYAGDIYQYYYTHCGVGFLAQNSENYCFGLAENLSADSIIIKWPTGHIDRIYNVASASQLIIIEGSTTNGEIFLDEGVIIREANFPSNIEEVQQKPKVKVFPNPYHEFLYFETNYAIMDIRIYNVLGQEVFQVTSPKESPIKIPKNDASAINYIKFQFKDGTVEIIPISQINGF